MAVVLLALSVPAGLRMRRLRLTGTLSRLAWDASRFVLAITAGTALVIAAIWGGR